MNRNKSNQDQLPSGIVEEAIDEAEHTIIRIKAGMDDIPAENLADTVRRNLYMLQGEGAPEVEVE